MCSTWYPRSPTRSSSSATSTSVWIDLTIRLPGSSPTHWLRTASRPRLLCDSVMRDQDGLRDVGATCDDLLLPPVEPVYTTTTSRPWRHLNIDEFFTALMCRCVIQTHGLTQLPGGVTGSKASGSSRVTGQRFRPGSISGSRFTIRDDACPLSHVNADACLDELAQCVNPRVGQVS